MVVVFELLKNGLAQTALVVPENVVIVEKFGIGNLRVCMATICRPPAACVCARAGARWWIAGFRWKPAQTAFAERVLWLSART